MDQTPDKQLESQEKTVVPRAASPLQRIIEHGLSFVILTPAVASFFAFLLMMVLLIPSRGAVDGVGAAFAISSSFLVSAYLIGAVPSLLIGLAAYPLWRQFGGGWQLYLLAALFNATLCAAVFAVFWGATVQGILVVAALAALATLATVFLTRKLRM